MLRHASVPSTEPSVATVEKQKHKLERDEVEQVREEAAVGDGAAGAEAPQQLPPAACQQRTISGERLPSRPASSTARAQRMPLPNGESKRTACCA